MDILIPKVLLALTCASFALFLIATTLVDTTEQPVKAGGKIKINLIILLHNAIAFVFFGLFGFYHKYSDRPIQLSGTYG